MKIYFTASLNDTYDKEYRNIIQYCETLEHTILSEHTLSDKNKRSEFQKRTEYWIKYCDYIIADVSNPSISLGYEIALAIRMDKPLLIFHGDAGVPSTIYYIKYGKMITERYAENTYKETIKSFMSFADASHDLRFNFFITPSIAAFLDEIVRKQKMPRSVYVRKLIEEAMKEQIMKETF